MGSVEDWQDVLVHDVVGFTESLRILQGNRGLWVDGQGGRRLIAAGSLEPTSSIDCTVYRVRVTPQGLQDPGLLELIWAQGCSGE